MAFLTFDNLKQLGFKKIGKDVKVSDKASIYGAENIEIGDYTRIDDFSIISAGKGGIKIGRNVHIACYCSIIGSAEIILNDFCGISSRVSIYSSNDNYSGICLTGPTIPAAYRQTVDKPVIVGRHVIVGSGGVILPGVTIGTGAAVGALSLVNKSIPEFEIHAGVPAKFFNTRSRTIIEVEQQYLNDEKLTN
jgi:galactoside O-acetyltransferase